MQEVCSLQKDIVLEKENCKQISSDRYCICSRQHQALIRVWVWMWIRPLRHTHTHTNAHTHSFNGTGFVLACVFVFCFTFFFCIPQWISTESVMWVFFVHDIVYKVLLKINKAASNSQPYLHTAPLPVSFWFSSVSLYLQAVAEWFLCQIPDHPFIQISRVILLQFWTLYFGRLLL